eukprot:CAMPEP_0113409710 /NCGR_PEP_ID=MMETSP0013_2-20120614/21290_1 /TAXON_ID=2843 ORGANISM="Skeletonema costatum, Strain 1716" /NCGR_SAMPLE_ID=MMETSP0013_2 /ASSEMBLY_ACC=CAM_ASM_000158 /LENGTH=30 /DNA_ID=CAMNT_0000295841 /DNA_START=147 /DNA_END=239 /DNA_ORIENTATION=- /assembly_acc=CAM_ASM_000158
MHPQVIPRAERGTPETSGDDNDLSSDMLKM